VLVATSPVHRAKRGSHKTHHLMGKAWEIIYPSYGDSCRHRHALPTVPCQPTYPTASYRLYRKRTSYMHDTSLLSFGPVHEATRQGAKDRVR
jgi:hypothetical protein